MALSTSAALIATSRFGFAARPGELAVIAGDPRGWALAQLDRAPAQLGGLPPSAQTVALMFDARRAGKEPEQKKEFRQQLQAIYRAEVAARTAAAAASDTPLLERLTHFWGNHFTVSGFRPVVRGFAPAFEREAIRPHVVGRFADMLLAAEQHPAMLLYLDNALSIGPDSWAGRMRGKGLNENLGRETLELHTLGVDGGYSQHDVEALAKILTGWSVARPGDPWEGRFRFYPRAHEPGAKLLLGRRYPEAGEQEGIDALNALAVHPATAQHIATKLARHFIADDPPHEAVARIARSFRDSGGDLGQVTRAVIREPAAWARPFAKLRTPSELVISAARVARFTPQPELVLASLRNLDQPAFMAPAPAGWPDDAAHWLSPEAVLRRAQWCELYAGRVPEPPDPSALAAAALGDDLGAETHAAIRAAPSRRIGLALLLASPEFQRR